MIRKEREFLIDYGMVLFTTYLANSVQSFVH